MPTMPLSKSALQAGAQCPRMLWFRYNLPSSSRSSGSSGGEQFAIGNLVGEIAQQFFDDGKTVVIDTSAGFSPDNYEDYMDQTYAAMDDPEVSCIAEAAFYTGDIIVFVDLLHRNAAGGWDIYEVKSSRQAKPVHAQDCAWQTYVVRTLCGVDVGNSYLLIPDRGWSVFESDKRACTYRMSPDAPSGGFGDLEGDFSDWEVDEVVEDALSRRFGTVRHDAQVWYDRLGPGFLDAVDVLYGAGDSLIGAVEKAAEYAEREDRFVIVDDYTDWIYDQSVGDEIPEKCAYFTEMVHEPQPPACRVARPGFGFECMQPYQCDYAQVCGEYLRGGL